MIDILIRADPSRARTDREKQQADEVYKPGVSFRVRVRPFVDPAEALWLTQVGTSRYQLPVRRRQTQRSLKVASLHVPVHIAYPAIASAGNAQIQCPTQRRIQNTLGPWMRVHPQGTVAAEIGLSIPPSHFVLFALTR